MWAQMMAPVLDADALEEHEPRCRELGEICGAGRDPRACGQSWCVYFDAGRGSCGLLAFDIAAILDRGAVSWSSCVSGGARCTLVAARGIREVFERKVRVPA